MELVNHRLIWQDTASVISFTSSVYSNGVAGSGSGSTTALSGRNKPPMGPKVEVVYNLLTMLFSHDRHNVSQKLLHMSANPDTRSTLHQVGNVRLAQFDIISFGFVICSSRWTEQKHVYPFDFLLIYSHGLLWLKHCLFLIDSLKGFLKILVAKFVPIDQLFFKVSWSHFATGLVRLHSAAGSADLQPRQWSGE